jgi:hypothetical protein
MPHKRNTELCERVRGLTRRIQSAALEELGAMDLWLERDISHSATERFTFPDCFGALAYSARLVHTILAGLVVYEERMRANIEQTHGAIYANRLLNALLETDRLSRTDAYEMVKSLSQRRSTPASTSATSPPATSASPPCSAPITWTASSTPTFTCATSPPPIAASASPRPVRTFNRINSLYEPDTAQTCAWTVNGTDEA